MSKTKIELVWILNLNNLTVVLTHNKTVNEIGHKLCSYFGIQDIFANIVIQDDSLGRGGSKSKCVLIRYSLMHNLTLFNPIFLLQSR